MTAALTPEALVCGFCGEPCEGRASISIGGETRWYHHGDKDVSGYHQAPDVLPPSCYERAQWEMSGVRPDRTLLENEVMREVYGDE